MSNTSLDNLPKPFFVLAPMDDVTDTVFRQLIAELAPPDLFFTEFVNVDALQSKGREATLKRLRFSKKEHPIIAQIWGKNPENFYKVAKALADGTLADEANWYARRAGLDEVQGNKERRKSRTNSTVTEERTQVTQQFAKSNGIASGFARRQDSAASVSGGFDGVDLNFGCPDKNVVRNGTCSAFILPENREAAVRIVQATREGLGTSLPLSVKTRLGFNDVDLSWHELLLQQKLNMLSVHGRTKRQMSKVSADWQLIEEVRKLRDRISPATLMVGNGDVLTRQQGLELAQKHGLDGVMIGRGVFQDPFIFAEQSRWHQADKTERLVLYRRHVELFAATWKNNERKIHTLNKFCKIYIQNFEGAGLLREALMKAETTTELLYILDNAN